MRLKFINEEFLQEDSLREADFAKKLQWANNYDIQQNIQKTINGELEGAESLVAIFRQAGLSLVASGTTASIDAFGGVIFGLQIKANGSEAPQVYYRDARGLNYTDKGHELGTLQDIASLGSVADTAPDDSSKDAGDEAADLNAQAELRQQDQDKIVKALTDLILSKIPSLKTPKKTVATEAILTEGPISNAIGKAASRQLNKASAMLAFDSLVNQSEGLLTDVVARLNQTFNGGAQASYEQNKDSLFVIVKAKNIFLFTPAVDGKTTAQDIFGNKFLYRSLLDALLGAASILKVSIPKAFQSATSAEPKSSNAATATTTSTNADNDYSRLADLWNKEVDKAGLGDALTTSLKNPALVKNVLPIAAKIFKN